MVLEFLFNFDKIYRQPWLAFMMGVIFASIGIVVALSVFRSHASLVMIFFTCLAAIHFVATAIKNEEHYDIILDSEKQILKQHSKTVFLFVLLFVGMLSSYILWALVLPDVHTNVLFSVQEQTIASLNGRIANNIGAAVFPKYFFSIFFNNIRVLILSILFSFLYGAGALFILTWNASVGGIFIKNYIVQQYATYHTWHAVLLGAARYLPHGLLEMGAYFIGALAGGIISYAVINHDFASDKFYKVVFDSSELIVIAIAVLIVASVVEISITPAIVALLS